MSGHTPGPWAKDHHGRLQGKGGIDVVLADSGLAMASGHEHPERYANSRLISAAPELLEAVQRLIGSLGVMITDPDNDGDIQYGRAAISKATGESP